MSRTVVSLLLVLFSAGCALPQTAERYVFARDGKQLVTALRYAGRAANLVHVAEIEISGSLPFQLRLPDSQWVRSSDLSRSALIEHGVLRAGDASDFIAWHLHVSPASSAMGRHQSMLFRIGSDGKVTDVSISACGYTFGEVLRTDDGSQSFSFPISAADLTALFGPPTRVERIGIITGFSCL